MTITMIEKTIEREVAFDAMGSFQVDERSVDLSAVGQDVEALAIDFVQQALAKGLTSEDIHDLVSEQILLLGGGA